MKDFRTLCDKAVQLWAVTYDMESVIDEMRFALAQPEPEGLTDEELLCIAAEAIDGYGNCGIKPGEYEEVTEQAVEAYGSELIAYARAVLARWGNHPAKPDTSLQPIPVSERLPEPEDCDGQGMCWWWHPSHRESDAPEGWMQRPREWGFVRVRYISDGALVCTHWLPAHALPLPTHD